MTNENQVYAAGLSAVLGAILTPPAPLALPAAAMRRAPEPGNPSSDPSAVHALIDRLSRAAANRYALGFRNILRDDEVAAFAEYDAAYWALRDRIEADAKRISGLEEIVVYVLGDGIRGEQRGGEMSWEDIDATFEAAKSSFPDLYERAQAENPDEDADAYDPTMGGASAEDQERANGPRR
jgi:hypothetical protein